MRNSSSSVLLAWSLVIGTAVAACGGKVIEGEVDLDGGVGGGSAGKGGGYGGAAGHAGGVPAKGGSAGYAGAGGYAGYAGGLAGAGGYAGYAGYAGGLAGAGGYAGYAGYAGGVAGGAGYAGGYYGFVKDISFNTPFLYDEAKLDNQTYFEQHPEGVLYYGAFSGYYTSQQKFFPPPNGQTIAYGAHADGSSGYPPAVYAVQYSFQGENLIQPYVYLQFLSDQLKPGPVTIGLDGNAGAYFVLFHMLSDTDYCAAAVGFGQIMLTAASNTTAQDGGKLSITAPNGLPLYHPTQTPIGDVSAYVGSVCPME